MAIVSGISVMKMGDFCEESVNGIYRIPWRYRTTLEVSYYPRGIAHLVLHTFRVSDTFRVSHLQGVPSYLKIANAISAA